MTVYPQLTYLADAYFHQDYDLDAPTAADIIRNYLQDEDRGAIRQLAAEIRTILDSDMTDEQIGSLWTGTLKASYEPANDALTYRAWLAATLSALEPQR